MSKASKFWNFTNATAESADLLLYGDISETSWYDDSVTPKQFAQDLRDLGPVNEINVHINSGGGDVFAGIAIYNQLRANPATVNVVVDGLAASIASIIAMAGDTITMPTGSMMMIHNPASCIWGAYTSDDFRGLADRLDTIKNTLLDVYQSKSCKSRDEIAQLMDDETWYSPEDALAAGFATATDAAKSFSIELDKNCLISNGIRFTNHYKNLPKNINAAPVKKQPKPAEPVVVQAKATPVQKEDGPMELAEFKNKYPDLYKDVYNAGVDAERSRMQAIDDIAMPGYEDIVNAARYETGASAEAVAVAMIKKDKAAGADFLKNREADAAVVNKVPADGAPITDKTEEQMQDEAGMMIAKLTGGAK